MIDDVTDSTREARMLIPRWTMCLVFLHTAGLAYPSHAGVILVTSPGALAGNDSIDWKQLGPDGTFLNTSEAVNSLGGLGATVSTTDPTGMQRLEEGPLPATWQGNFTVGNALLSSLDINYHPLTINFATPVSGAGANIQQDAGGTFTATIEAFNGNTSLGSFTENGISNQNEDGSAIFIGLLDTKREITKLIFGIQNPLPVGQNGDFAINALRVNAGIDAVPGPPSLGMVGTAALVGPCAWLRKRRRSARYPRVIRR